MYGTPLNIDFALEQFQKIDVSQNRSPLQSNVWYKTNTLPCTVPVMAQHVQTTAPYTVK